MAHDQRAESGTRRREFLRVCSAAAASAWIAGQAGQVSASSVNEAPEPLPSIALGPHQISRLVLGWNPIGGHSHTTLDMARCMREYFTVEKIVDLLEDSYRHGITAWQFDHTDKAVEAIRTVRERGLAMHLICLHAERAFDAPIQNVLDDTAPIAIVHHGGVTDAMFRAGQAGRVRDFVKKVHDHGCLAGVSAHNPDNIKRIADEGWENDLFMCCFYYVTRPVEEQREKLGKVTVGEPFFESDPEDMTNVIKQVNKPCLGFKILAAGRVCWSKPSIERAFQFAFRNIKPTDGVIVGMFPRYSDQVGENAALARKYGAL